MALQETLPLCFLLVPRPRASSYIRQGSHLSVVLFPQRTQPLVVSTVPCRLRVPNLVLLASDYLVLILFPRAGSTSQTVGKKTPVWCQPWLSPQLSEDLGKCVDLCPSTSWTPPFSRPHTPSPPLLLMSAHHASVCASDVSRAALCYFHAPCQSVLHSSWNEHAVHS